MTGAYNEGRLSTRVDETGGEICATVTRRITAKDEILLNIFDPNEKTGGVDKWASEGVRRGERLSVTGRIRLGDRLAVVA